MTMYGLATLPLIKLLNDNNLTQKWYAVGNLKSLRIALDNLMKHGKYFGYQVKAPKCQLIVTDNKYNEAIKIFKNIETKIKKKVPEYLFLS